MAHFCKESSVNVSYASFLSNFTIRSSPQNKMEVWKSTKGMIVVEVIFNVVSSLALTKVKRLIYNASCSCVLIGKELQRNLIIVLLNSVCQPCSQGCSLSLFSNPYGGAIDPGNGVELTVCMFM